MSRLFRLHGSNLGSRVAVAAACLLVTCAGDDGAGNPTTGTAGSTGSGSATASTTAGSTSRGQTTTGTTTAASTSTTGTASNTTSTSTTATTGTTSTTTTTNGTTGGGQAWTCEQIWACLDGCECQGGGQDCFDACFQMGSAQAQQAALDLDACMVQQGCYNFPICPNDDGQRVTCMVLQCTDPAQACFGGGGGGGACSAVGTIVRCTNDCQFETCKEEPVWGYGASAASAIDDCENNKIGTVNTCNLPSGGCYDDNCSFGASCEVQPGCPG